MNDTIHPNRTELAPSEKHPDEGKCMDPDEWNYFRGKYEFLTPEKLAEFRAMDAARAAKKKSDAEAEIGKIDTEYAAICQRLGDAILRKEALDMEIGGFRAQVQKLRDRKQILFNTVASVPS